MSKEITKWENILNPYFVTNKGYFSDDNTIGNYDIILETLQHPKEATVIMQTMPYISAMIPKVTKELKKHIHDGITLQCRKDSIDTVPKYVRLFFTAPVPIEQLPNFHFNNLMEITVSNVTHKDTKQDVNVTEIPKKTEGVCMAKNKVITPENDTPETEVSEVTTVIDKATDENVKKIDITCKNCGHSYSTNIYLTPDGKVDKKKTQARCSKCKRKNTATVISLFEESPSTDTPVNEGNNAPHTPPKIEVTIPNRVSDRPIEIPKDTQKTEGILPPKKEVITPDKVATTPPTNQGYSVTQPLAPIPIPDMKPLFRLLHDFEDKYLIKKRGEGITPECKDLLDNLAQMILQHAGSNPTVAQYLQWLPEIGYVSVQGLVLAGPSLLKDTPKEEVKVEDTKPKGVFNASTDN